MNTVNVTESVLPIYWNYPSIAFLIIGIFYLISGIFALSIRDKSPATWHAAAFFLLCSVLTLAYCVAHALYDTSAVYHRFFTIIPAISAGTHILQFLLNFPRADKKKLWRIMVVQWLLAVGVLLYFAFSTLHVTRSFHFSNHIWDFDAELLSRNVGFVIVGYTVIYIVFGIWKIFRLRGTERWVFAGMLLAFISLNFVPGILNVMSREGALDRNLFVTLFTLIALFGGFAFVILYINNTSDRTTFMVKITGITFVTILVASEVLTFFSLQGSESAFDSVYTRAGQLYLLGGGGEKPDYIYHYAGSSANSGDQDDQAQGVDFHPLRQEFENTLALEAIRKSAENGIDQISIMDHLHEGFRGYALSIRTIAANPSISPEDRARMALAKIASLENVIAYRAFKIEHLPDSNFRAELRKFLEKSGKEFEPFREAIEAHMRKSQAEDAVLKDEVLAYLAPARLAGHRWYRHGQDGRHYFAYMYIAGGGITELGFPLVLYRASIHQIARRIVLVIMGVVLFVLVGFRVFFGGALLRPLRDLLRGVRQVNEGDLDVSVMPRVEDEIGFLARSFNGMVYSIRQAREQLREHAASLEETVQARTAQLRETLTQVQNLKTQQDGDYFLTSLLLEPLRRNRAHSKTVGVEFFQRQKKSFTFRHWKEEIGGDLCTANNLHLNGQAFTVFLNADAMGKSMQGAGGALVLGSVFEAIVERTHISVAVQNQSPERWIKNAFIELHHVFEAFDCSMLVSMVLGLVDEETGLLYFINAEHPYSILYRDARAEFLETENMFKKLGSPMISESGHVSIRTFQLKPHDVIIVGSDGRDDLLMHSEGREPFMNEDETLILRLIERTRGNLPRLFDAMTEVGQVVDDVTFIRIGYREGEEKAAPDPLGQTLIWRRRALDRLREKRYSHASSFAEVYAGLNPGDTEFLFVTSYALRRAGYFETAAEFGERVRLRNPVHMKNLLNLSDTYARMGQRDRARELLKKTVYDLQPDNQRVLRRMNGHLD